jgi:hypothetical protein
VLRVSDPILLLLTFDMVALLALGAGAVVLPAIVSLLATAGLSGLGAALCLVLLLFGSGATTLTVPAGPPGLHLHLALGALPGFFLLLCLLAGCAITGFQATTRPPGGLGRGGAAGVTALCLGGTILALLAADGLTLVMGTALVCGALLPDWTSGAGAAGGFRRRGSLAGVVPLLLLGAVCLLTPIGFVPRFDAMRAAPVDAGRASAAAMMTLAAVTGMICLRAAQRDAVKQALLAGVVVPLGIALLIRLVTDVCGQAVQAWWGLVFLAVGSCVAVVYAWRAAAEAEIDESVACLVRWQAGLMVMGVGLALIAAAADMTQARSLGLDATMLLAVGGSLGGTLAMLAIGSMGVSAGTPRMSRLGGLIHTMPGTSAALAAGCLSVCALPPGVGFAAIWLLFQSLLAAPRSFILVDQLPVVLVAIVVAVSAAAATSALTRMVGIALLGRPRTPLCAGAREASLAGRAILAVLAGASLFAGFFPGSTIETLAGPALRELTGGSGGLYGGVAMLTTSGTVPGYAALPVVALLGFATGVVILLLRWLRRDGKAGGAWFGGMKPPEGLPFGEPMAQSVGSGFLPALPELPALADLNVPRVFRLAALPRFAAVSVVRWLWLVLAAFGVLMVTLSMMGVGG